MRRPLAACVVVAACLAGLGWPGSPAAASCIGPVIGVDGRPDDRTTPPPPVLVAGQARTVDGLWFRDGCDDTGLGSGCGAPPSEESAQREVELVLVQGDRRWGLGTADARPQEEDYAVVWEVELPDDVSEAPARLEAGAAGLAVEVVRP